MRYTPIFLLIAFKGFSQVQPNRNGFVHQKILVQSGTAINGTGHYELKFYKGNDTFIVNNNTADWYLGQDSGLSWDQPLVFINNSTKKIRVNGINAENCQYVKIIGFGSDSAYGFEFYNGGVTGVFQGMMKGILIEGCRFTGGSQGGVWIKEEAPHACDYLNYYTNVDTDPAHAKYRDPYQYLATGNKPFDSIYFRHNMVDSCGGEALYFMSTGAFGRDAVPCLPTLPDGTKQYAPTQGKNCHADSNYVRFSGRTGIQGNLFTAGNNTMNDNIVRNVGYEWAVTHGNDALNQGVGIRVGWACKNLEVARNNIDTTFHYNLDIEEAANVHDNYCDNATRVYYGGAIVNNPQPLPGVICYANNPAVNPLIFRSNIVKYATASAGTKIAIYGGNKFLSSGNDTCFNTGKISVLATPFNANPSCSSGSDTTCHDSTYTKYYDTTVTTTIPVTYIPHDSVTVTPDSTIKAAMRNKRYVLIRKFVTKIITYYDTIPAHDTTFICTGCGSKDTTVQVCVITGGEVGIVAPTSFFSQIEMTPTGGQPYDEFYWLNSNNALLTKTNVNFPTSGTYRIDVSGYKDAGTPNISVTINGIVVGNFNITTSNPDMFSLSIPNITAGTYTVILKLTNFNSAANYGKIGLVYFTPSTLAAPPVNPPITPLHFVMGTTLTQANHFGSGFLRGFNLGSNAYNQSNANGGNKQAMIDMVATGANIARCFIQIERPGTDYQFAIGELEKFDSTLARAARYGYLVVPVLFHDPSLNTDYWGNAARKASIAHLWRTIVNKCNGNKYVAAYDLINEPRQNFNYAEVIRFQMQMIDTIRALDPNHVVMVECVSNDQWAMMLPVPYNNVVYSPHGYSTLKITHQGISSTVRNVYPTTVSSADLTAPWGITQLSAQHDDVRTFAHRYHVPIFIGEFSCINWAPINGSSEWTSTKWTSDNISLLETEGWSWVYHAWRGDYPGWEAEIPSSYYTGFTFSNAAPVGLPGYSGWIANRSGTAPTIVMLKSYFLNNTPP